MIDPKFNELPAKNTGNAADVVEDDATLTGETDPRTTAGRSAGLSINDTIAADANLSVGSRGTDTSGVKAGAGAGGGQSYLSPASRGEAPSPNVVPGARGSGTTVLGERGTDQEPTIYNDEAPTETSESELESTASTSEFYDSSAASYPSYEEISAHAYRCWHERGCPPGSPEEDWRRAENELRNRSHSSRTLTASV